VFEAVDASYDAVVAKLPKKDRPTRSVIMTVAGTSGGSAGLGCAGHSDPGQSSACRP
jgi:hypothetical protein